MSSPSPGNENTREAENGPLPPDRLLAEKTESLSAMAIGIAHDFNNLIAAVLGNAGIILKSLPPDSPLRRNAQQIENCSLRALELTNTLVAYSGKGQFNVKPLDLHDLLRTLEPALRTRLSPQASLALDLRDPLPLVTGDPAALELIITNLVLNAGDALDGKAGRVTVATGVRQCDTVRRDDTVCLEEIPRTHRYVSIEIADTGIGMTPDVEAKIFDPFFTTKIRGRGLGLSVALGVVRAHGGCIRVHSEPGRGSRFTILLPAREE